MRRAIDLLLCVVFCAFAAVAFTLDAALACGVPLDGSGTSLLARTLTGFYVGGTDALLVENPPFVRVMATVNAFVFGPFYLVLAYALCACRRWIRVPALLYSAAMTYNMVIVFGVHAVGGYTHDQPLKFLGLNLPFLLAPLVLAWRMCSTDPFPSAAPARPQEVACPRL
jgi:EXPERA (EXPanded EBP superfamily)